MLFFLLMLIKLITSIDDRCYNKNIAIKTKIITIATEVQVVNFIKLDQVFFCELISIN